MRHILMQGVKAGVRQCLVCFVLVQQFLLTPAINSQWMALLPLWITLQL